MKKQIKLLQIKFLESEVMKQKTMYGVCPAKLQKIKIKPKMRAPVGGHAHLSYGGFGKEVNIST